jgi:hypothetical protein
MLTLGLTCSVAPSGGADEDHPAILTMPRLEREAESGILRPVPIHVDLPPAIAVRARRVLVHYLLWGDDEWTTLELGRHGRTRWDGAIPCLEVFTITGDLVYYLRVHDIEGRVIASGGSRANPYRVIIRHDELLSAEKRKRAKCPDPSQCPPGFPGCPSAKVVAIQCASDRDCEEGMSCGWSGICERDERAKNWFGVWVEQDVGVFSRSGACSLASQENEGYACFREDETQYIGHPVLANDGLGAGLGPTRIVVSYERLVFYDISLGLRLGWAVRGALPSSPGGAAFVPFSAAARVSYWFGADPFARAGFRPTLFATGGYGMFDLESEVEVREDPTKPPRQEENDLEQTLDVHERAGDGFVGVGLGLHYAIIPRVAVGLEVAGLATFPIGAFIVAPNAGLAVGF